MKGLKFIILCFLISIVNSERSNHIQRYPSRVSDSSGSDEELDHRKLSQEGHNKCKVFGVDPFSTSNPKIQFEIFVREPIRYMQGKQVDVTIYNQITSKYPIEVKVTIPNNGDNSKFFDNESDPDLTRIISASYYDVKYVGFNIRIKDIVEINAVMNITIKASVKSENYECYLTQPVEVKLPRVKVYDNSEKTFNLIPTHQPILMPIRPNNSIAIEDLRTSVVITGHRDESNKIYFSVTLTNEYDFNQVVHVTTEDDPIKVDLPENTKNTTASIKGTGLCSIKVISEGTVLVKKLNPKFNLDMTRLTSPSNDQSIVRICATYDPKLNDNRTLPNVIYHVEMQCGFVYEGVIDKSQEPAIMRIDLGWNGSQVQIIFDNFEGNKNYCVDLRARNKGHCYYVGDSDVMVYDNDNIENLAVGYYNFDERYLK